MTTASEMQAAVDKAVTNMERIDGFTNGGPDATVTLDGGVEVPSIQKVVQDTGWEAGAADTAVAAAAEATTQADRASLQSFLGNQPFADETELEAYTNALLEVGDSTITRDGGVYVLTVADPLTWVREDDSDGRKAGDAAAAAAENAAEAGAIVPKLSALEKSYNRAAFAQQNVQGYSGTADVIHPMVVDALSGLFLGANRNTGELDGSGVRRLVRRLLGRTAGILGFSGISGRFPVITDAANGTVLGVDSATGGLYGSGVDRLSAGTSVAAIAISTADRAQPTADGWNGLIVYGQSNSTGQVNASGISPVTAAQPYANLTFGGGPRSNKPGNSVGGTNTSPGTTTTRALYEDNANGEGNASPMSESPTSSASNYAIQRAIERDQATTSTVIFASAPGHGGYRINQLNKAAAWYVNFIDHVTEAKARATAAGVAYVLHAVCYDQGEADADAATARATYAAALSQLQADMTTDAQAITGQSSPVHLIICQPPWKATTSSAAILGAFDAVKANPRIHMVGNRANEAYTGDTIHMTPTSQWRRGRVFGRAYQQLVWEARKPDAIWPISATTRANGTTLTALFRVPTRPLVLDTTTLAAATDMGFKVVDDAGTLTLSNIAVSTSGDAVTMTLNRALSTNAKLRYALDYRGSGLSVAASAASGNLRDSTSDTSVLAGTMHSFPHLPPHFEIPIFNLEA